MKALTLRTKLTLSYSIIVSLLLTGFALLYNRVLTLDLNRALTDELVERASGLRGYLRVEAGKPVIVFDESDPEEVAQRRFHARRRLPIPPGAKRATS